MSSIDNLQCAVPADWSQDFSQCLYEWQGLEAGGLAIVAALIGAFFIRRQITLAASIEDARLRRSSAATRAISSLVFSQICRASQRLITRLGALRRMSVAERLQATDGPLSLDLSNEIVPTLERLLNSTEDEKFVDAISALIIEIQVTESRLETMGITTDFEVDDRLIDLAGVYAFSERLLEFVRKEIPEAPDRIEWHRISAVLRMSHVNEHRNPAVHARVQPHLENGSAYWDRHQQ